jgi:tetratricopeptide (TPR) repeat protein
MGARRQRPTSLAAVLFGLVFASAVAQTRVLAQSAPASHADALFHEGIDLANAKRYADAIDRFKASYALDPARGTLLALALAEERSNHLGAAYAHYESLVAAARQAADTEREQAASARIAALEAKIGKVTIVLPASADASVTIDQEATPVSPGENVIAVDAGAHRVEARSRSGLTFSREISVVAGGAARIEVTLEPVALGFPARPLTPLPASPRGAGKSKATVTVLGWTAVGAGAVAEAIGAYLWFDAGSIYNEVKGECASGSCGASQHQSASAGEALETGAQVCWIAGGAAILGGAALLLFVAPSKSALSLRAGLGTVTLSKAF